MPKVLPIAVLMLVVAGSIAATRPLLGPASGATPAAITVDLPPPVESPAPQAPTSLPLPPPDIGDIPIAMVTDLHSGQTLYARNIEERFLPASVTKVMTLYLAFDLISSGRLSPGRLVTVSDGAWREWHGKGSRMFLERGSQVSVDALLMGIANVSANDGCVVLAEGVAGSTEGWVAMMNAEARKLGMLHSHFNTPNGWMDNGQTYYTARDLTRLADAMLTRFPALYHRYIGHPAMTWNGITQPNHDPTLGVVPGADGIKTGFTVEAGYNFLGSAERDGRRLVLVIAHAANARERAKAARALLEWGFSAWDARRIYPAGQILADARVQQGAVSAVGLVTPAEVTVTMPKGTTGPVSVQVRYAGPLIAPIARGEEVAQLEVRVANQPVAAVPLVAAANVARGDGIVDRLRDGLGGLWK